MWLESVHPHLLRPLIDSGTRFHNVQTMAEFADDPYMLEELMFVASNYKLSLYVSFVSHCIKHRLDRAAMTKFINEGDQTQSVLHSHVKRRQEVLDEINNSHFECDSHKSTRQCRNPNCRKIGNFATVARQTRSADEGMRPQLLCNYCGTRFNA